jgi:hypothetical protein
MTAQALSRTCDSIGVDAATFFGPAAGGEKAV